jgi:hypothetical protein
LSDLTSEDTRMKLAPKTSVDTRKRHAIHVLLAYDSPRTCRAILRMFDRISARLRDKALFKVNAFKFGLLASMDPVQCGAGEAGMPELAVVAFGKSGTPGAELLSWLENWAECHAGKEAALGLLPLGPVSSASVRRAVRISKDIATRYSLGFICDAESRLKLLQEQCTVAA